MVKKAELHCHLEGSTPPALIEKIAKRNQLKPPYHRFSQDRKNYKWDSMDDFFKAYDEIALLIRTPEDYFDITLEYLRQCANEDVFYVELLFSPEHTQINNNIPYIHYLEAINDAIKVGQKDFDIIATILFVAVRNFGPESAKKVARLAARRDFESVVGFDLAGDEKGFPPAQFKTAFEIAKDAGLGLCAHAGEFRGPAGIYEAIDNLALDRLQHGVRAIEDKALIQRLKDEHIHLALCPSSNLAFNLYSDFDSHPFRQLYDSGLSVSLNSDDPPFMNTTIGYEYDMAKKHFDLDNKALKHITTMAINAAFVSDNIKKELLRRLEL